MKKVTNKEKIEVLERIIKAIFGTARDEEVVYKNYGMYTQVEIECDVNDVVEIQGRLQLDEIETYFSEEGYIDTREYFDTSGDKVKRIKKKVPCAKTLVTLYMNPVYWKKAEELEEELKKVNKELKQLKNSVKGNGTIKEEK